MPGEKKRRCWSFPCLRIQSKATVPCSHGSPVPSSEWHFSCTCRKCICLCLDIWWRPQNVYVAAGNASLLKQGVLPGDLVSHIVAVVMFRSLGSGCVACFYFRDAFTDDSQERSSLASCQWASKRHILCQSGWSDNTGSRELEGVSHYLGIWYFNNYIGWSCCCPTTFETTLAIRSASWSGPTAPERV